MRPTSLIFPAFFAALLAVPIQSSARPPAPANVAHAVATHAVPLAEVPEASLVPPAEQPPAPKSSAEDLDLLSFADAPDEPAIAEEIDKDSADIEAVRQAEEASHVAEDAAADGESAAGTIELIPQLGMTLAQLQAKYDIPIDVNESVVAYIRFFQSSAARSHFAKWLGRSHKYLDRYRAILREEGVPEDTVYLAMIESGFGNFAYSRARASGPWQFIAATGKHFGLRQDFWVDERRDPERSARAAAKYLKLLHKQTGDWRLAWAGYNAGVGRIFKAKKQGFTDFWEMAATPGRKVLRAETKGYVPKLMAAAIVAKHPEAFGFRPEHVDPQSWTEYEEVDIPSATLLSVVAKAAGVTERELIDLNPELRRACTPPRAYALKIPKASADTFAARWPEMQPKIRLTFAGHVVKKGDTLSGIAHRHGVPLQGIVEMNGLKNARRLRIGQELMIPRPVGARVADAVAATAKEPTVRARTVSAASRVESDRARTTHRVRAGDTLWSISRSYNVDLDDLCRWNGIKSPARHKLFVGAKLVVHGERG